MSFEDNGALQKWYMTKTPPEIDKYDTHKNGVSQKQHTLQKNALRLPYLTRTQ